MTSEEIERTLQIVVGNQTRLSEAQIRFGARQAELDEVIKQLAMSHQELLERFKAQEERIDGADSRNGASDEKLATRVKYEVRQERLEEAFNQVAESQLMIVQLASVHGERLDGHDKANVQTESRLAALIDAQVQLSQCVETLASNIAAFSGCIDRIGAHLDQALEQINAFVTAQTRTDEQIKIRLDGDGSPKPRRKSTKAPKKAQANDYQRESTRVTKDPSREPGAERDATGSSDGF
jgi:chromosome segregation ATPase